MDRLLLEIIPEGEIAEHLEKGVMPGGIADIVEIVVFSARADAFLRRGGADIVALLGAGEDVLERHHPGVGEHERRVVARHQRRGLDKRVAVPGEKIEESGPDFVDAAHGMLSTFRLATRALRRDVAIVPGGAGGNIYRPAKGLSRAVANLS